MKNNSLRIVAVVLISMLCAAAPVPAQENFYKGKTVRVIVGGSAGGGYDTYTRTIARHLGKHIPGNPAFVVENMTGAGSIIAANYVYKVARPDGLTICHFIGGIILQQALGKVGIEFDARKFIYLGAPAQDTTSVGVTKASGVTSMEQWLSAKTPVKFGGIGPGTATDDLPKMIRAVFGLPIQLVTGYKGTADIRLAVNSGEMHGLVNSWESFKSTWVREIESGFINIILVGIPQRHPELPNVPSIGEFAKTDEAKKLIQVAVYDYGATARPYVFPPNTPPERVQILRKGLAVTLKDPEFLADAQRARLDLNPLSGEELENTVARTFALEKPLVEKLKSILNK
ncbi:MAG TPA: tripartite tricarboxylate transporter substrate-binding protein [Candidatus Binatia bacterium]